MNINASHADIHAALKRFARALADELDAERVILFGSHARNTAEPGSDLDIIIVSRQFEGIELPSRSFGLRDLWYLVDGDSPMNLICLTPEEFELAKTRITLVDAVLPESIELLPGGNNGVSDSNV